MKRKLLLCDAVQIQPSKYRMTIYAVVFKMMPFWLIFQRAEALLVADNEEALKGLTFKVGLYYVTLKNVFKNCV